MQLIAGSRKKPVQLIAAERPVNIRTIERYLLLAGDLPGLKFKNSIKPHPTKVGAAILVVEVTHKPVISLPASTIAALRPAVRWSF